jgi:4'-phosphopantetheinyl transferase
MERHERIALPKQDLHVWYFFTPGISQRDLFARYGSELSTEELSRFRSFRFSCDSLKFLASRVLLRNSLSAYCDTDPSAWEICSARHGKPHLRPTPGMCRLKFNQSRTNDLSALVVSASCEVGIDVEDIRLIKDPMPVAAEAFTGVEVEELLHLDTGPRRLAFLENWTLKEAYLKARGVGLSGSLREVSWGRHESKRVLRFNDVGSDETNWRAFLEHPSSNHVCSVVAESSREQEIKVRFRKFHPDI